MSADLSTWAVQTRYDEVAVTFRSTWDLFLKFYTVFLTFNVISMAFIFDKDQHYTRASLWLITTAFVVICGFAVVTCYKMIEFSSGIAVAEKEAAKAVRDLALANGQTLNLQQCFKHSLPISLAVYSAKACVAGTSTLLVIWLLLAIFSHSAPSAPTKDAPHSTVLVS